MTTPDNSPSQTPSMKGSTIRAYHPPSGGVLVGVVTAESNGGDLLVVPEGLLEEIVMRRGVWSWRTIQNAPSQ